jgi:hypothetical protein
MRWLSLRPGHVQTHPWACEGPKAGTGQIKGSWFASDGSSEFEVFGADTLTRLLTENCNEHRVVPWKKRAGDKRTRAVNPVGRLFDARWDPCARARHKLACALMSSAAHQTVGTADVKVNSKVVRQVPGIEGAIQFSDRLSFVITI